MTPARLTRRGQSVLLAALALFCLAATAGQALPAAVAALMLGMLAGALLATQAAASTAADLVVALETGDARMRPRTQAVELRLHLLHRGRRPLRNVRCLIRVDGEPSPTPEIELDVPAGARAETPLVLTFPRAGHWRTQGVEVRLGGPLGLSRADLYRPAARSVHVRPLPVSAATVHRVLQPTGANRDREGRHTNRAAGSGLELRELRDYVPGDPLKTVAWKATARRQRPLVRSFEEETIRRMQLLVDVGPTMRAGGAGGAALDRAVDLAAAIAESHVRDRIGLTTFDHRVYGHLRPNLGRAQFQRLVNHLLDLSRVVDEDLTEITDAELLALVGGFLEVQDGRALRRYAEDPSRPRVARTMVDPLRELFDESAVFAAVTAYLAEERDRGHAALFAKSRPARDLLSARMRLFCALRGLSLPYRITGPPDAKERGLVAAVSRNLTPGAADTLVLLSDLRGLSPSGPGVRALRLARAHKRRVVVVQLGPEPAPAALRQSLQAAQAALVADGASRRRPDASVDTAMDRW